MVSRGKENGDAMCQIYRKETEAAHWFVIKDLKFTRYTRNISECTVETQILEKIL